MLGVFFLGLLLLSGYLTARSLLPEEPPAACLSLGAALGLTFLMLCVFALHPFHITPWAVRANVAGAVLASWALFRRSGPGKPTRGEFRELLFWLPAGILVALLVYFPHISYPFPLHFDEWFHLATADRVLQTGQLFIRPYDGLRHIHAESGFHALLSGVFLLTGWDPLTHFKYLPALASALTGLALFSLVKELTGSLRAGMLGTALYGTIKSNGILLGPMVLSPFTLGLLFMFAALDSALRWVRTKGSVHLLLAALLVSILAPIHPSLCFLTLVAVAVLLALERLPVQRLAAGLALIGGLLAGTVLLAHQKGTLAETLSLVASRLLIPSIAPIQTQNYFEYVTPPLFLFVIWGFYGLWRKGKEAMVVVLSLVFLYFLYSRAMGSAYFIRPERLFLLTLALSVLAAAVGLEDFLERLPWKRVGLVLALALVGAPQFSGYYQTGFFHYLSEGDYETLVWLKKNYSGRRVLTRPGVGLAIPFTGNFPVSYVRPMGMIPRRDRDMIRLFDEGQDCEKLREAVRARRAGLVVSREPFPCPFLRPVYSGKGQVYEPAGL